MTTSLTPTQLAVLRVFKEHGLMTRTTAVRHTQGATIDDVIALMRAGLIERMYVYGLSGDGINALAEAEASREEKKG
jgi:hypothetical protein